MMNEKGGEKRGRKKEKKSTVETSEIRTQNEPIKKKKKTEFLEGV